MRVYLHLTRRAYEVVRAHLLQDESEQAAFFFMATELREEECALTVMEYYLVPQQELAGGGDPDYLELLDGARAKVIKMASDKKLALGESHSHPFSQGRVSFSPSDRAGLGEFVPHIWWRLRAQPYVALVMGQRSFDALAWLEGPDSPIPVDAVILDGCLRLKPSGLMLARRRRHASD